MPSSSQSFLLNPRTFHPTAAPTLFDFDSCEVSKRFENNNGAVILDHCDSAFLNHNQCRCIGIPTNSIFYLVESILRYGDRNLVNVINMQYGL